MLMDEIPAALFDRWIKDSSGPSAKKLMLKIWHDSILLRYLLTYLYSVEVFRSVGKFFQKLHIFSVFNKYFISNEQKQTT